MKMLETIGRRISAFFSKYRFSVSNAKSREEQWYVHISPAQLFAALLSVVVIIFVLLLTLVAYTPVLELLPGYRTQAQRHREMMTEGIIRLDSMERVINDMLTYNNSMTLIMEGRTPVVKSVEDPTINKQTKILVMPSGTDSLLRSQIEQGEEYSLNLSGESGRGAQNEFVAPVEGVIFEKFSIADSRFGVSLTVESRAPIVAIADGTVILNMWDPVAGYVVGVQHADNVVSIYKRLGESQITTGQVVRSAELLGYAMSSDSEEIHPVSLEIWRGSKPIDPENFIVF